MKSITAANARKILHRQLDQVALSSEPVRIIGKRANAVLVSEPTWRALAETVYLSSKSGVASSIREGMEAPLEECIEELDW